MTPIPPLVRFELVRRLRWRPLVLLLIAHPAGCVIAYVFQPPSDPLVGTDVAIVGMQLVWLFLLSFELGRDRELGLDALLTSNIVRPGDYVLGKLIGLGTLFLLYHAAVVAVVIGFDPAGSEAARSVAEQISLAVVLLPLVLATELFATTRLPMAYVAMLGIGTLLIAFWSGLDTETIEAGLGLSGEETLDPVRPALLGAAGLVALFPLARRRVAGRRPF
ncbi:MAG: hypothetical protein KY397_00100 [Gemmatimonadetes bacterium]|nr:hypothetical protein [Gemmatimonadota bacterium]